MPADLDRRSAFRLLGTAGAVAFAAVAVSTTAGCGSDADEPEPVDPLVAQASAARADAAAALAAIAVNPDHAGALQVVADQRSQHADALDAEVARAAGTYADGSTPTLASASAASAATVSTSPAPVPALPLPQLRDRVAASQASAAALAPHPDRPSRGNARFDLRRMRDLRGCAAGMSERSERIMSQRAVRMPEPSASEAQA